MEDVESCSTGSSVDELESDLAPHRRHLRIKVAADGTPDWILFVRRYTKVRNFVVVHSLGGRILVLLSGCVHI